jgi:hypothetical protein
MEDNFFQKNQNGGQVQNGVQGNFHYLISREQMKLFSICLRIRVCHFICLKSWKTTFQQIFLNTCLQTASHRISLFFSKIVPKSSNSDFSASPHVFRWKNRPNIRAYSTHTLKNRIIVLWKIPIRSSFIFAKLLPKRVFIHLSHI